jgi:opacity protein-like surface antigen
LGRHLYILISARTVHRKIISMKKIKYILTLACAMPAGAAVWAANMESAVAALAAAPTEAPIYVPQAGAAGPDAPALRTMVAAADMPRSRVQAASARPDASRSPFYVGAQLGDSSIGASVGYQISSMFLMELSYDYTDPKYTPTTLSETSRISASGLALFPIKFSDMGPMAIFVRVGYGRTTDKYTVNDPGLGPGFPPTSTVTTTIKTGVQGGAGVQVDLSANTSARLGVHVVGTDRSVYLAALYSF